MLGFENAKYLVRVVTGTPLLRVFGQCGKPIGKRTRTAKTGANCPSARTCARATVTTRFADRSTRAALPMPWSNVVFARLSLRTVLNRTTSTTTITSRKSERARRRTHGACSKFSKTIVFYDCDANLRLWPYGKGKKYPTRYNYDKIIYVPFSSSIVITFCIICSRKYPRVVVRLMKYVNVREIHN